ncbi:MAG: hypothetical protein ACKOGD_11930, partial [Sphingomonadales bacterium]
MGMTNSIDVFLRDGCGRCSKFGTDNCSARMFAQQIICVILIKPSKAQPVQRASKNTSLSFSE